MHTYTYKHFTVYRFRRLSSTTPDGEVEQCATEFSTSPVTPYRSPGRQRKKSAGQLNGEVNGQNGHEWVDRTSHDYSSLGKL